jgi:hypothetical protein
VGPLGVQRHDTAPGNGAVANVLVTCSSDSGRGLDG